ncbi:Uncharacterized protein AUMI_112390 [Aurantimicrobium minutum]|uniref:Uncharacterized protein n=2 Tax=Aurantimicrobium minutum TaxID=708131 RepID=A0A173LZ34_9MICO|nr:Uncharacterized protein AUMI_112390 [Aurantimicrobium minutum]
MKRKLVTILITIAAIVFASAGSQTAFAVVTASDGTLSSTFGGSGSGFNGTVNEFVVQPDGKIVAVGNFTQYNGINAPMIVRLNADGSIDQTLNVGTGFPTVSLSLCPKGLALQPDGKIVVTGSFRSFNGNTSQGIVRLNSNGSFDSSFVSPFAPFAAWNTNPYGQRVSVLSDGSILVVGEFMVTGQTSPGTPVGRIAKLSSTGTLDTTFNSNLGAGVPGSGDGTVVALEVQPDGKILVGGTFTTLSSSIYTAASKPVPIGIARLNADGSPDTTFTPQLTGAMKFVMDFSLSGNQIFVAGFFTGVNSTPQGYLIKLSSSGTLDSSFNSGGAGFAGGQRATGVTVASDGSIYVAGSFTTYNGSAVKSMVRLSSTGTLDPNFSAGTGFSANPYIVPITEISNGDVLIGGAFSSYNGTAIGNFAKLTNVPADAAVRAAVNNANSANNSQSSNGVTITSSPALAETGSFNWMLLGTFGVSTVSGLLLLAYSLHRGQQG